VAAREPLRPDDLFAEAGRKVLARHLARMLERERGTKAGDELALKQMRVATRRMRSVWRVFDGAYRRSEQRRYVAELRAVARRLGAVRDLDVLIGSLPAIEGLQQLAESWRSERAEAAAQLLAHLESPAYSRFVADYRAFVGSPTAAASRRGRHTRVADVAGVSIESAYQQLLRLGRELDERDISTFHALRIAGKSLRYALETFRDLLPVEPLGRCDARLVTLQDALGGVNDRAVAADHLAGWLAGDHTSADPGARSAVEAYVDRQLSELEALRTDAVRAWRAVASPPFQHDIDLAVSAAAADTGDGLADR
jgi:CHAD domain-containing protein